MSKISRRIKAERRAAGLTQAELAERTGLNQSYISRLERGDKAPGSKMVEMLAKALGVPVARLFGESTLGSEAPSRGRPRADILVDPDIPPGLRDLANDEALVQALGITDAEWRTLHSIQLPSPIDKGGYVQILYTIRAVTHSSNRVTQL